MNLFELHRAIERILASPLNFAWYRDSVGTEAPTAEGAAWDFLSRTTYLDISPVRFFDPLWFRSRYRINGVNAFLEYVRRPDLRLAWPSPLFAPRWYCRRYGLTRSTVNPLLDFFSADDLRSPHPLLDCRFLAGQSAAWRSNAIAMEFLTDADKHRLKPHPLFDSAWYLDNNLDVALAGMNPLEHYLRYGYREGRQPNRMFSVAWYADQYLSAQRRRGVDVDPLTHYVTAGYADGHIPSPGLESLRRTAVRTGEHGPLPLIDAVERKANIYLSIHKQTNTNLFRRYMPQPLAEYNPLLPENILLIRRHHVAIMYTPKCGSARIVYWWLAQIGLLETALRFSGWSHDFAETYQNSRECIVNSLSFDPRRYRIYKFVRNPIFRAASMYRDCLRFPSDWGIREEEGALSFSDFLRRAAATNYFSGNIHCVPQTTSLEKSGVIRPEILRIEDGVDAHLHALESTHGLPGGNPFAVQEVRAVLQWHTVPHYGKLVPVGPDTPIPFRKSPSYEMIITDDTIAQILQLYGDDFKSYDYPIRPLSARGHGDEHSTRTPHRLEANHSRSASPILVQSPPDGGFGPFHHPADLTA